MGLMKRNNCGQRSLKGRLAVAVVCCTNRCLITLTKLVILYFLVFFNPFMFICVSVWFQIQVRQNQSKVCHFAALARIFLAFSLPANYISIFAGGEGEFKKNGNFDHLYIMQIYPLSRRPRYTL